MSEKEISRIGVIGAGSWGTTLANLLAEKGMDVTLWVWEKEVLDQILTERINGVFLPSLRLVPQLKAVGSLEEAVVGKQLVLLAVPSHVLRGVLSNIKPYIDHQMVLIAATKGIENDTLMIMSQVIDSVLTDANMPEFACLTGPSFAKEVAQKCPTAVTIGCRNLLDGKRLQRLFYTDFLRVYVTKDVIGAQLGGALKNVIAIAAGACDGLKFGHNARAALITRGLAEITRLGVAMGSNPLTFSGLAGMGDLVLTCTGDLSRNRTVGVKIGKGMRIGEITESMKMVAEGVKTTRSAYQLARKMDVEMPIVTQVYQILYEEKDPREAVKDLMTRVLKTETES